MDHNLGSLLHIRMFYLHGGIEIQKKKKRLFTIFYYYYTSGSRSRYSEIFYNLTISPCCHMADPE